MKVHNCWQSLQFFNQHVSFVLVASFVVEKLLPEEKEKEFTIFGRKKSKSFAFFWGGSTCGKKFSAVLQSSLFQTQKLKNDSKSTNFRVKIHITENCFQCFFICRIFFDLRGVVCYNESLGQPVFASAFSLSSRLKIWPQIDTRPGERFFQEEFWKVCVWTKRQFPIVPPSFHVSI